MRIVDESSYEQQIHFSDCDKKISAARKMKRNTHIIDQSRNLHMDMFPIQRSLQQLNDIHSDGVFRLETFRPSEEFSFIDCGLFDGETTVTTRRSERSQ